ncbi:hypothetical protein BU15DRAFT_66550 [Melanogaster broomeanus]|nr:hypothetical protein BU15DRAFT_66550 [Melanogaster broomeanus]
MPVSRDGLNTRLVEPHATGDSSSGNNRSSCAEDEEELFVVPVQILVSTLPLCPIPEGMASEMTGSASMHMACSAPCQQVCNVMSPPTFKRVILLLVFLLSHAEDGSTRAPVRDWDELWHSFAVQHPIYLLPICSFLERSLNGLPPQCSYSSYQHRSKGTMLRRWFIRIALMPDRWTAIGTVTLILKVGPVSAWLSHKMAMFSIPLPSSTDSQSNIDPSDLTRREESSGGSTLLHAYDNASAGEKRTKAVLWSSVEEEATYWLGIGKWQGLDEGRGET